MAEELATLTKTEQDRLAALEAAIRAGLESFMEVGLALSEIRESKLYRGTHGTFEAYCEASYGFSGRRGRQLMKAAKIGTMVPVSSEREARALAPLAEKPELLEKTVETVKATGEQTPQRLTEEVNRQLGKPTVSVAAEAKGEQLVLDLGVGKYERWKAKADESGYTLGEFVDACVEAQLAIDGAAETAPPKVKAASEPQETKTAISVPAAAVSPAGGKVFTGPDPKVKGPVKEKARGRR